MKYGTYIYIALMCPLILYYKFDKFVSTSCLCDWHVRYTVSTSNKYIIQTFITYLASIFTEMAKISLWIWILKMKICSEDMDFAVKIWIFAEKIWIFAEKIWIFAEKIWILQWRYGLTLETPWQHTVMTSYNWTFLPEI